MRIVVSGTHASGKSTLIADFAAALSLRPYLVAPSAASHGMLAPANFGADATNRLGGSPIAPTPSRTP